MIQVSLKKTDSNLIVDKVQPTDEFSTLVLSSAGKVGSR